MRLAARGEDGMPVYLVTRQLVRAGLQMYAAVLLDPVSRREVHAVVRWDARMAEYEMRAWASRNGYLPNDYRPRAGLPSIPPEYRRREA